ncbi:hypothetical protein GUJ93_ZPchr0013g35805 [Zizania palustris]|uniref:Uncharacterized protein n=1 Tax=Zizania palustris TaxID=103762 RepID=A0A8J6BWE5_ZIZPA|nr:hypothetical protein GUJ93_ZPchr0013g35805 [Zizania palustris]
MCTFKLLIKVINHIDRARRHCLWRGYNSGSTSHPRVAWKLVCKPKRKGGLGVVNLRTQNSALLLKHIKKFFSSHDIPWVRLVWHHYHSLRIAPHLAPPKGSHWWKDVLQLSIFFRGKSFLGQDHLEDNFNLPLSQDALQEFYLLKDITDNITRQQHIPDTWTFIWGSPNYSSRKYYVHQFKNLQSHAAFAWL